MRWARRCLDFTPIVLAVASGVLQHVKAKPLLTGYWTDWAAADLPPERVNMARYDIINFSFGLPTSTFDITFNSAASTDLLSRLVAAAAKARSGTRIVLSIGGWLSSEYFSAAVATDASRASFASNIGKVIKQYRLDGVDVDWEYPGSSGAGNPFSPSDAANFQRFLGVLRATLGPKAIITVTVSHEPWDGPDGRPIADVSSTAAAVDAVLIMNYDVNQGTVGVNAPLADLCGNSSQPRANAAAGVKQWVAAGMPRHKILLGVPAYGYIVTSAQTAMPQRRETATDELSISGTPPAFNASIASSSFASSSSTMETQHALAHVPPSRRTLQTKRQASDTTGQIDFLSLVTQGILAPAPSTPAGATSHDAHKHAAYDAVPTSGYTRHWDTCTHTPYLSNPAAQRLITYDDPASLRDKAEFARRAGLAGVGVWSLDADTADGALGRALAQGLGLAR